MEEIVDHVQEAFPGVKVSIHPVPSYVQFFSKNTPNVVLVHTKGHLPTQNNVNYNRNNTKKEDLELTGSPLKMDLSLHLVFDETMLAEDPQMWTKDEATHDVVGLEKARHIANLFNEQVQELQQEFLIPLWVVTEPSNKTCPFLLTIQSFKNNFIRGIVNYEGNTTLDDVDFDSLEANMRKAMGSRNRDSKAIYEFEGKYLLGGMLYDTSRPLDELLTAPHTSATSLNCEWKAPTFQVPLHSCKVNFEQHVIVGNVNSPCHSIWKSVCALQSINQLLVDITAAGTTVVKLENVPIGTTQPVPKTKENAKRLNNLLKDVNMYTFMVKPQKGGFICATDNSNTLKQVLNSLATGGSSNDFTYRLWDILKDCENADELVTLLIQALKVISSGKMRPFIDANNKTYLGKLVLKLSRGHSQTAKVLKNLRSNPQQSLSLVGQVGFEKTMWEFTNLMSMVEHSFFITGIWSSEVATNESIEQINQTIYDMTLGGDSINPFGNKSSAETSIRIGCESFCVDDDDDDLNVDDFASLRQLGATEKKTNEVPLIADEIDISGWKNLLMKFAQVHVCLEHLNKAQECLNTDFAALKPVAARLREHFVADKSPIKTVGQLMNEPIVNVTLQIDCGLVKDHLLKPAYWYRLMLDFAEGEEGPLSFKLANTFVFTQQPIFPPLIWKHAYPEGEEPDNTILPDVKYYFHTLMLVQNTYRTGERIMKREDQVATMNLTN